MMNEESKRDFSELWNIITFVLWKFFSFKIVCLGVKDVRTVDYGTYHTTRT